MAQDVKQSLDQRSVAQHQQRASTRRAYWWWGIGASLVLLAIVLIWAFVFIPQGQLGSTARQATGGPTGVRANQGSGESTSAKNNAVVPQTSAKVGAGQNSPAAAAQIEQTAGPLQLTDQQRARIRSYFTNNNNADRIASTDFALSIGAAVPQNVPLQKLPPDLASVMRGFQADEYVMVGNQLVIVDPNARRVVAVVPNAG
jgi:Protein of unknown function (DUF1236)